MKLLEDKPIKEKFESETLKGIVDLLKAQILEKDDQIKHLQKINEQFRVRSYLMH